MLGSIESANSWHWAAWGKHPVARDYFRVGAQAPLVKAFSDWVQKGYQILSSKGPLSSSVCSWRFWARGFKREAFVCGVGRGSSDSVGRLYPLLIMGTGPLEGWEDQWDLLPFACEKTWDQMENLSARRFTDFREFENGVHVIKPPHPSWSELIAQRGDSQRASSWNVEEVESVTSSVPDKPELFVPLDGGGLSDPLALVGLWHAFIKAHSRTVPNAVFMGGAHGRTYLAVFRRALAPTDFVRLWSICSKQQKEI